jgi:hypothetical protein
LKEKFQVCIEGLLESISEVREKSIIIAHTRIRAIAGAVSWKIFRIGRQIQQVQNLK